MTTVFVFNFIIQPKDKFKLGPKYCRLEQDKAH